MRISRFASALALSLALVLMPAILIAEPAPANTAVKNMHTKRHTGHVGVDIPESGAPPAAERFPIRAFAQSTCATTEPGISPDSASNLSAHPNLVERSTQ